MQGLEGSFFYGLPSTFSYFFSFSTSFSLYSASLIYLPPPYLLSPGSLSFLFRCYRHPFCFPDAPYSFIPYPLQQYLLLRFMFNISTRIAPLLYRMPPLDPHFLILSLLSPAKSQPTSKPLLDHPFRSHFVPFAIHSDFINCSPDHPNHTHSVFPPLYILLSFSRPTSLCFLVLLPFLFLPSLSFLTKSSACSTPQNSTNMARSTPQATPAAPSIHGLLHLGHLPRRVDVPHPCSAGEDSRDDT